VRTVANPNPKNRTTKSPGHQESPDLAILGGASAPPLRALARCSSDAPRPDHPWYLGVLVVKTRSHQCWPAPNLEGRGRRCQRNSRASTGLRHSPLVLPAQTRAQSSEKLSISADSPRRRCKAPAGPTRYNCPEDRVVTGEEHGRILIGTINALTVLRAPVWEEASTHGQGPVSHLCASEDHGSGLRGRLFFRGTTGLRSGAGVPRLGIVVSGLPLGRSGSL